MASSINFSAITDYPFQPFTKIYSADINGMFTIISTPHAFTRYTSSSCLAAGTANFVVYNDANGDLTEAQFLPTAQGGMGTNLLAGSPTPGSTVLINTAGTGFSVGPTSGGAAVLFNFANFT